MEKGKAKILEVQPHNIFLAEKTLNFFRKLYAQKKSISPIEIVIYKNIKLTYNGDHRLYLAHERGLETIDSKKYFFDNEEDRAYLDRNEYEKYAKFWQKEGLSQDIIDSQAPPTKFKFDENRFMDIVNFVRSDGVYSVVDFNKKRNVPSTPGLKERILETKEAIQEAHRVVYKEYSDMLEEQRLSEKSRAKK